MEQRFVKVLWLDACSCDEWTETDKLPAPIPVTSMGWMAKEEEDYIVLAASHYGEEVDVWGQTITIPSGMIVKMDDIDG